MLKSILSLILIFLFSFSIFAQDAEPIIGEAYVTTVEVIYSEEGISLVIAGDLPDSCTELGEISQSVSEDILTITVSTNTPPDVMCAQVLSPYETTYLVDTSELEIGTYTLNVNGVMAEIIIDPTACPEVAPQTYLYDAQGICFLFPEDYSEFSGEGFVMITQPNSNSALIVLDIQTAEEDASLDDFASSFEGDSFTLTESRLGGQEALIIDASDSELRLAYVLFEGKLYSFSLQPFNEEAGGEALWENVMGLVFFDGEEDSE